MSERLGRFSPACPARGRLRCALAALLLALIPGCMVGPDYHFPQPSETPETWAGVTGAPATSRSVPTAESAEIAQWWRQFGDPTLTALVEDALAANLDVQLAVARLRQARATRGVVAAGLWPSVSASASYQYGRLPGASQNESLFQSGLDAIWEVDLFGGVRRNVESAGANVQAAVESIRDAQVTLAAEVALSYLQLRGAQEAIRVAQENLGNQQHTAAITRQKYAVGFVGGLDVANADAVAATTAAQIPGFETSAQQAIYALGVLLARPPATLLSQLTPPAPLPQVPAQIAAGLPSDLLRRRPDIRAAEAQLHAATAQIGVARAALFPQFSLTGSVNWQSNLLPTWWSALSRSFGVGPSMSWPILQGGAIISNIRVQEALRDQALLTYQKAVLGAFQDVENALVAFTKEQQHREALQAAVVASQKSVDLSTQLYVEGLTDFLNVLVAQNTLYSSQAAVVQSDTAIVTDLVALYKALGGGWDATSEAKGP